MLKILVYLYKLFLIKILYFFFKIDVYNCHFCRSNLKNKFYSTKYYFQKIIIYNCDNCALKYQSPILNKFGIKIFYKYFYRFDYNFISYEILFNREMRRGEYILKFLNNFNINLDQKKILEIGTGSGGILKKFKSSFDCEVFGIDLDKNTINFGKKRGLDLAVSDYDDYNYLNKYDFLILSHVLEHILDLKKFVNFLKNILNHKAIIYIEVPGMNNHKVKKRNYSAQPSHLYYFDLNFLSNLFESNGFKIIAKNEIIQILTIYEK